MKAGYIFSIITLLTITSCQLQDTFQTEVDTDEHKLSLTIESIDPTKTFLDAANTIHWSEDDQVMVFNGTTKGSVYILHEDFIGETYGEFVFVEKIPDNDKSERIDHSIVLYPYNNETVCHRDVSDGNKYELTNVYIPTNQKYANESFSKSSFPMAAVSEYGTTNLSFKNLCGMIKLQLSGECAVKSIKLSGNNNERISGEAKVVINTEYDIPAIEMSTDAEEYIVLDCSENPVQLNNDNPTTFILSLPPTNFTNGFTVVITDVDGNEIPLQTDRQQNVKRSSILRMPPTSVDDSKFSSFEAHINEVGAFYVDISVHVDCPHKLAYILREDEKNISDPTLIFDIGTVRDIHESEIIRISDIIEEDTQYHLYMVAKQDDDDSYSEIIYLPFKTPVFEANEILTVIGRAYDGYKMRITVPEYVKERGNAIRYAHTDIMTYNYMGIDDYTRLLYYNGAYDKYVIDDQTIEYSDALNKYYDDGEIKRWARITPGEPIVYIAGEFKWMNDYQDGNEIFGFPKGWYPGYYMPMIDPSYFLSTSNSIEQSCMGIITDYEITRPMDSYWTGAFQRKHFRVREPGPLDGGVEVKLIEQGPTDLTFEFNTENVHKCYIAILNKSIYEMLLKLCNGREDYLQWAITSDFSEKTIGTMVLRGSTQVKLTNIYDQDEIDADSEYIVLVTSMGDEVGTRQNFQKFTFKTSKKTKKAPEVLVTPLPEKSTPYEVVFNIKCTTFADNPFVECYFAANYVHEWIRVLSEGSTYFSIVAANKLYKFYAEELVKINSAEGLEIKFPSIDGETTRLVVLGYNEEYTPNDLITFESVEECTGIADCTTPWLPEKEQISRDYYIDLVGDWTATATLQPLSTVGNEWETMGNKFVHKSKITITNNLSKHHPTNLTDDVYKIYEETWKYDKDMVDDLYEEFKNFADVVTRNRLMSQNRLVAMGWFDKDSQKRLDTYTPYDLFIDKNYKFKDASSIFNDYGPKWYIDAVKDEDGNLSLIVPFDSRLLPPAAYWNDLPICLAGIVADEWYGWTYTEDGSVAFPVEVSEDRNTITIKPFVDPNGLICYPNMIAMDFDMYYIPGELENAVISDVVLTRGWTEPAEQMSASVAKASSDIKIYGEFPTAVAKQRTPLNVDPMLKTVETSFITMEQFKERADKFIEMKFGKNN